MVKIRVTGALQPHVPRSIEANELTASAVHVPKTLLDPRPVREVATSDLPTRVATVAPPVNERATSDLTAKTVIVDRVRPVPDAPPTRHEVPSAQRAKRVPMLVASIDVRASPRAAAVALRRIARVLVQRAEDPYEHHVN
jgi:hypothetical protein